MGANHPMPFSASERAAGLGRGQEIPYLRDLPADVTEGEYRPLPALPADVQPVITIPSATGPTYSVERSTARPATVEASVTVPLAQAAITAGAVGVMAGLLAWVWAWSWRVPVVVLALAFVGAWLWRLGFADRLLWSLETLTRHDLDGNGTVGAPTFATLNPAQARATVARETAQSAADAQRAALLAFVDRCYLVGCSESAHGVQASGPDRDAYTAARDTLINLGVAAWKNPGRPRGGWALTTDAVTARAIVERHVI